MNLKSGNNFALSVAAIIGLGAVAMLRSGVGSQVLAGTVAVLDPAPPPKIGRPLTAKLSTLPTDDSPEMSAIERLRQRVPNLTSGLTEADGFLGQRDSINADGELVSLLSFRTAASMRHWYKTRVTDQILSKMTDTAVPAVEAVTQGIPDHQPTTVLVTLRPTVGAIGALESPVRNFSLQVYGAASAPLQVGAPKLETAAELRTPAARIKRAPLQPLVTRDPLSL